MHYNGIKYNQANMVLPIDEQLTKIRFWGFKKLRNKQINPE